MTTRTRASLVLSSAAVAAAITFAGCGGSSSSGSEDPASLAPADSPLFVEASVRPEGELKANIESLSKTLTGISDPGSLLVEQLDSSIAQSGQNISYETDIQPWLGEKAGIFFERYDGQNFSGVGFVVETTNSSEASDFVDKIAQTSSSPVTQNSYNGVDYITQSGDGTSVGVVGDFLVLAEDQKTFEAAVDTSEGDSLADDGKYKDALSAAPAGSFADIYVNIGDLINSAGAQVDQQVLDFYNSLGVDFSNSTALASIVPGSDQIEIDVSTNAGGGVDSAGLTDFVGSFPADSWVALASPDVGEQVKKVIDGFDENGIPGSVPPGKFKSTFSKQGIDLDKIAESIGDIGLFVEGTTKSSLAGALVIQTTDSQAASEAVSKLTDLVKQSSTAGFKQIPGGFSMSNPQQLGSQPVEIVAKGDRVVVGYGDAATQQALSGSGATLDGTSAFDAATKALGDTPLTGFLDIQSVLKLLESMGASSDSSYQQIRPFLGKLDFAAVGSGSSGDLSTSKIVVKVAK